MKPYDFKEWKEERQNAYTRALKDVWNSYWFNTDSLEDDDEFIEFMKERYEDDAYEECKEENE